MAEATLINARLSWLLTIQGFLFGGYALIYQKLPIAGNGKPIAMPLLENILTDIAGFGIFVSVCALMSIIGAWFAITKIEAKWRSLHHFSSFLFSLPGIRAGGSKKALFFGNFAPRLIPLSFIFLWLFLLFHQI